MARGQLLTMSSLNGSIGGLTFRQVGGSNIMSGKITTGKHASSKQSQRHVFTTYFASAWRTMTAGARRQWRSMTYNGISGFRLYMYCRLNLAAVNTIANVSPRQPLIFPALSQLEIASIAGGSKVYRIGVLGGTASNYALEVQLTAPVSAGTGVVKDSWFRTVAVLNAPTTSFNNITTAYNNTFGTDIGMQGQRVFIRVRIVQIGRGYASPWLMSSSIVS